MKVSLSSKEMRYVISYIDGVSIKQYYHLYVMRYKCFCYTFYFLSKWVGENDQRTHTHTWFPIIINKTIIRNYKQVRYRNTTLFWGYERVKNLKWGFSLDTFMWIPLTARRTSRRSSICYICSSIQAAIKEVFKYVNFIRIIASTNSG